ncbi:polysaccharide biosynthesis protein [Nigerium massiliense]|uniref:hypothetical protein n=1 Tax=Nigerium massiliense TaxID=1522317 RepID=UPI00058DD1C0|nr:hypothetical protein [Nigerium massiliense]
MRGLKGASPWVIAGVLLGLSGFVAQIISAQNLPVEANQHFLVYLSLLLALTGSLAGVQGETSRAAAVTATASGAPSGARVLATSVILGAVLATLVGVSSLGWLPAFLPGATGWTCLLIGLAVAAYAGESAAVGALIGRGTSGPAAMMVGADAVGRMVFVAIAAAVGAGLGGYQLAIALPMASWVAVLAASGAWTQAWSLRVTDTVPRFVRNLLFAVAGGACTSFLVNGYPAVLASTSHGVDPRTVAPIMNAIVLTRAPLLLPLLSFQGLVVSFLIKNRARLAATLTKLFGAVWVLAGVVAAGMWLLGPWFLRVVYGPDYELPGMVLAGLTAGAGCTATLVAAAASALALGRHRRYLAAWLVGTALAFGLLFIPGDVLTRVLASLVIGPLVGAAIALVGLRDRDSDLATSPA